MKKLARGQRRLAIALFLLNLTGARAIAVTDACDASRVFFVPSLSFRALAKTMTRQDWKSPGQRSLGERAPRYSAQDLETLRNKGKTGVAAAVAPAATAIHMSGPRPRRLYAFKLPSDLNPVQPPHLHSKK